MRETFQSQCPLCKATSQYYEIDFGERHYYRCSVCTKFIITDMGEKRLRASGGSLELSKLAQLATTGTDLEVLEIASDYMADKPLTATVVKKSNYQL